MQNKETDPVAIKQKKFNLMIAVVVLLMVISFIALKIKGSDNNLKIVQPAKAPAIAEEPRMRTEDIAIDEEKKINISDVVSADKMAATGAVSPIVAGDHVIGSSTEPVQLVVYSDFECAYCAQFAETVAKAKTEFGDKLAVVFRHYPLTEAHPYALLAAEASECAADQNKFWEMHDVLFRLQRKNELNSVSISQAAQDIKLSKTQYDECLSSGKHRDRILAQVKEAKAATVSGSPTSFINGELITGANPYEDGTRSDGSKLEGLRNKILRKLEGK